jgi:hypothetical protein
VAGLLAGHAEAGHCLAVGVVGVGVVIGVVIGVACERLVVVQACLGVRVSERINIRTACAVNQVRKGENPPSQL